MFHAAMEEEQEREAEERIEQAYAVRAGMASPEDFADYLKSLRKREK